MLRIFVSPIFRNCTGRPSEPRLIGLDVGVTAGGAMAWGVFAPTAGAELGALAGTYVGASGSVGVGVGVGANMLFGGSGRSISLQPLSVEGSVGINLSLGVSGLTLALAQ